MRGDGREPSSGADIGRPRAELPVGAADARAHQVEECTGDEQLLLAEARAEGAAEDEHSCQRRRCGAVRCRRRRVYRATAAHGQAEHGRAAEEVRLKPQAVREVC